MTSIVRLKTSIEDTIKYDSFSSSDLINVLTPISSYISSTAVYTSMNDIVGILLTDKNKQLRFEMADIHLFGNSEIAIIALSHALINAISGVVGNKLTYVPTNSELLVFKMVVYCFMIVIPRGIGRRLTIEEKSVLLITALSIYDTLITSQTLPNIYSNVQSYMKQQLKSDKIACSCNTPSITPEDIAYSKKNLIHLELKGQMHVIQDQNDLAAKIRNIEKKLKR